MMGHPVVSGSHLPRVLGLGVKAAKEKEGREGERVKRREDHLGHPVHVPLKYSAHTYDDYMKVKQC